MMDYVAYLIKKGYVSDDCVQVMEGYYDPYISIFGDRLLYHSSSKKDDCYNAYLEDSRRFSFPYNNIPSHVEMDFVNGKVNYVNQLYDFDKKYVVVKDGYIFGKSQFKLNSDECIVISEILKPDIKDDSFDINYSEVQDLVSKTIPDDASVISTNGIMCDKEEAASSILGVDDTSIVYVSTSLDGASASGLRIYRRDNRFNVVLFDLPFIGFSKHNAEILRENAIEPREPKIKRFFNPEVTKRDIISAQTMARYKN